MFALQRAWRSFRCTTTIIIGVILLAAAPALATVVYQNAMATEITGVPGPGFHLYGSGTALVSETTAQFDAGTATNVTTAGNNLSLVQFPDWWDNQWRHRTCFDFNHGGAAAANVLRRIRFDTTTAVAAGDMLASGQDIRVVRGTTQLPHRIVGPMNSATTELLIRFDQISAGANPFCVYYGNPTAPIGDDLTITPGNPIMNARIDWDRWWNGSDPDNDAPDETVRITNRGPSSGYGTCDNCTHEIDIYVRITTAGEYRFGVSGDDTATLQIAQRGNFDEFRQIAQVTAASAYETFAADGQVSDPIRLGLSDVVRLRARATEAFGNDHVSIGWQRPGDAGITVVDRNQVSNTEPPTSVQLLTTTVQPQQTNGFGTWESPTLDSGATGTGVWGATLLDATTPAGTAVRYQTAVSADPAGPFTFAGPGADPNAWFTDPDLPLPFTFDGSRYIRILLELSSTVNGATPTVGKVSLEAHLPQVASAPEASTGIPSVSTVTDPLARLDELLRVKVNPAPLGASTAANVTGTVAPTVPGTTGPHDVSTTGTGRFRWSATAGGSGVVSHTFDLN